MHTLNATLGKAAELPSVQNTGTMEKTGTTTGSQQMATHQNQTEDSQAAAASLALSIMDPHPSITLYITTSI